MASNSQREMKLNSEIMKVEEAAEYLRLSPGTLNIYRMNNEGPTYAKLGGAVRYRKIDLDAWVSKNLVKGF